MATGRFRADLLYRINIVDVALPPLRERTDFFEIARRELRGVLTRLSLLDPHRMIEAEDVAAVDEVPPAPNDAPCGLEASQVERVTRLHRDLGGNIAETARQLGVSRNTVYRALRRLPDRP